MYNQFFTIKPRISEKKWRKQSCTPNNYGHVVICVDVKARFSQLSEELVYHQAPQQRRENSFLQAVRHWTPLNGDIVITNSQFSVYFESSRQICQEFYVLLWHSSLTRLKYSKAPSMSIKTPSAYPFAAN